MIGIHLLLLILAFICFILAAFGVPTNRVNTLGLGLAFWVLTLII